MTVLAQSPSMFRFARKHKLLAGLLGFVVLLAGLLVWRMWGPYRAYRADLAAVSAPAAADTNGVLRVGVAKRDITPDLARYDSWTDTNGDSRFDAKQGDTYEDRNHNGTFDFVWLAGFNSNRPAQGTNDPLWVRAIAVRHEQVTVVMVTLDSIGLTHERYIRIRKSIDHAAAGITHILFSCTHTHNAPDTMGIWSYRPIFSKFDDAYLELVLERTRQAILEAVGALQPAEASYAVTELEPEGWVHDSRKPLVYDRKLCAVRFNKAGSEETIATLVSWGNHPEAMGGKNPLISSDWPHYLREGVERGLTGPGGLRGLGGMCLFFQGPVGGLMTPIDVAVPDRDGSGVHRRESGAKARALGENVAAKVVGSLTDPGARRMTSRRVAVAAKTTFAPLEGTFRIPVLLCLIHPGWYRGGAKTEVDAVRIGDLEILTVPGEIYPEITEGGVENPAGADYPGAPVEVPGLRSGMKGAVNMVFNLANDEVGYIIPKTQWDVKPPYTYGRSSAPYGEVNSGGSGVAAVVHRESMAVLKRLHDLWAR